MGVAAYPNKPDIDRNSNGSFPKLLKPLSDDCSNRPVHYAMTDRILFQLNLAKMRAPFDDSLFDDFKTQLETIHTLAEDSPGFLWRYQGEKDKGGFIQPYSNAPLIMGNMSAWKDYRSLYEYTFCSGHLDILKEKRKWFEKIPVPYTVLYYGVEKDLWNPPLELLERAKQRLSYLAVYGETPIGFGFGPHNGVL